MLCHQLYELANGLGPDAKLPTVVQLRDSMDVSMATLNSALKELESHNVIYRKHGVGIYVSPELNQNSVCLVCDSTFMSSANHSPFWDILIEQARQRATTHNENFELHFSHPNGALNAPLQRGLSREIEAGQVDGIIGVGFQSKAVEWIEAQGVPFVSIFGSGQYRLNLDQGSVFRMGIKHLQQNGCRRVGLWMPVPPNRPRDTEWWVPHAANGNQFLALTDEAGLQSHPELIRLSLHYLPTPGGLTTASHQEQGFQTATEVFSSPRQEWPDGLVISDDMMTQGALVAMRELRVRPGIDVKIASHANRGSPALIGLEKDLTLLEFDPAEIVNTAFSMLEDLMSGRKPTRDNVFLLPHMP